MLTPQSKCKHHLMWEDGSELRRGRVNVRK